MKRRVIFSIMVCAVQWGMAMSPVADGCYYECKIYFVNRSSYNIYLELALTDDPDIQRYTYAGQQLALERNDTLVMERYQIHVDTPQKKHYGDPNVFWKTIRLYDMDRGVMLYESAPGAFVHTGGSLETLNAVFELEITDAFLAGGGQ